MKEKKISIIRLRCVIDSKDIEFSEVYDTRDLTKGKGYILIRFHDDNEGNIQMELKNDVGIIRWYDSELFEIIHE